MNKKCSILNDNIVGGKTSNVLYSFSPTDLYSSYTFKIITNQSRWQKINTKGINKINIKFTTKNYRPTTLKKLYI